MPPKVYVMGDFEFKSSDFKKKQNLTHILTILLKSMAWQNAK